MSVDFHFVNEGPVPIERAASAMLDLDRTARAVVPPERDDIATFDRVQQVIGMVLLPVVVAWMLWDLLAVGG